MQFEKGKIYRFETGGLFYNSAGYAYITLKGGGGEIYRVRALKFQEDWGEVPRVIDCYVIQADPLVLTQSRYFILKDRYPQKGVWHTFFVKGVSSDGETGTVFYELTDEFSLSHRYYPKEGEEIKGDQVKLWVSGVSRAKDTNKAHLFLSLTAPTDRIGGAHDPVADYSESEIPGGEGPRVEFKSSLVFPAGTTSPDIDTQTKIIMQSLAGMMNAEGGTLYLGVNDDGNIRSGIEKDFCYLNTSKYDNHTYKEDTDGYENKIYSSIMSYLGGYAKTLSCVEIETSTRRTPATRYAKITVERSVGWPVWVLGKDLFVRTGNNTTHLLDNEITQFIWKRFPAQSVLPVAPVKEDTDKTPRDSRVDTSELDYSPATKPSIVSVTPVVHATCGLFENERLWGYLYFFKGREKDLNARIIPKDGEQPDSYEYRVALPKDYRNYELVICYENGFTDWISIERALFTDNGKAKRAISFGWKSEKSIINAFCVKNNQKTRDLVAYVSTKDGIPYVKCNVLKSLATNPHKKLDNSGNVMLENGTELMYALRVSGDKDSRMLLEDLGIIFYDRINHKNGRSIIDLPEKSKNVLSEIIDLYLCTTREDESPLADDVIMVTEVKEEDAPSAYDTAWVLQGENSFFVNGPAFTQMDSMASSSTGSLMRGYIKLWNLDESRPLYVVKFKRNPLTSEYLYSQILGKIIAIQRAFLDTGNSALHERLNQKNIAKDLDINDATVSRAIDNFLILAPGGLFKKTDIIASSGVGDMSEAFVVQMIREIRNDNPDAGDQEITDEINRRMGTEIARRTIAKYRRSANIPNSRGKH